MKRVMLGLVILSSTVAPAAQRPMEFEADRLIREAEGSSLSLASRAEAYVRAFELSTVAGALAPRVPVGGGTSATPDSTDEASANGGLDALSLQARAVVGLLETMPALAIHLLDAAPAATIPGVGCHDGLEYSHAPRYAMWTELISFFWQDAQPNPHYSDEARTALRVFARDLARIDSSAEAHSAVVTLEASRLPGSALDQLVGLWSGQVAHLDESRWIFRVRLPRFWPDVERFANRLSGQHRRPMAQTVADAFGRYLTRHMEDERCQPAPVALVPIELYIARDVNRLLQRNGLTLLTSR